MELKFKKAGHDYYEPLRFTPFSCETMRESIVPDSCADIARIVDTTGMVCLTSRELTGDGRFSASGTVEVSVLYIPEKGDGPRALHFQLPFQCYGEGQPECELLDIRGELRSIDTRLLNPRKVLTRANLLLYPAGFRHTSLSICTGMEGEDECIQLLEEKKETRVTAGVREKEFTFTEELPLSPGRSGAEEILSTRVEVRGTDCKLIGNKLVVKGLISASVLYREAGGRLTMVQQDLPFSQIIEGGGSDEDCECEAAYQVLSAECRVGGESGPDDAYVMTLTLLLRARVTVWRREEVAFIADLYSTAAPVSCETAELELSEDCQRNTRRQNVRELLETAVAVKTVIDTEVGCGGAQLSGGEMKIPVWARCLYLDENDTLGCVRKEFTASCPAEMPDGAPAAEDVCQGEAACQGDVITNIMPEGIELRLPLECVLTTASRRRYVCVSGGETEDAEQDKGPSLILRKLGPEETLWSVAKQYRTTRKGIMEVNELEEGTPVPTDRLLLIPKAR